MGAGDTTVSYRISPVCYVCAPHELTAGYLGSDLDFMHGSCRCYSIVCLEHTSGLSPANTALALFVVFSGRDFCTVMLHVDGVTHKERQSHMSALTPARVARVAKVSTRLLSVLANAVHPCGQ
jgi:hypothetical protein